MLKRIDEPPPSAGSARTLGTVRRAEPLPTLDEIRQMLASVDVSHVGVASADVLAETRRTLHERKREGLHGEMEFTYRNPDRSTDPSRAVEGARSVIVAARPYLTDTDPQQPDGGPQARVARYAWVDRYGPLRDALRVVARRIRRADERAVAFADDNSIVDRAVAHRAGVGWYGKNANLLIPGAGSWFVLGSIITTADYTPAPAPTADGCGSCRRCIDGCPTGAIVAPGVIDARRCLSWVLQRPGAIAPEFREAVHDRIYGCDDCQDVCPISVRLGRRNTVELGDDSVAGAWIDALTLLDADDAWINEHCAHWYIADRDVRWVRRNALVVLGNVGDPTDHRVRHMLDHYRCGIDPILQEHARWAIDRLDQRQGADGSGPTGTSHGVVGDPPMPRSTAAGS